jgi:hypothetical protein
MKGQIEMVSAILHHKLADHYFSSFAADNPGTRSSLLFKNYISKINWILTDMITHPALPQEVRDGIKKDVNSDVFVIPALVEKISLLTPENRSAMEMLVSRVVKSLS